jgi:hypothetical protein
VDSQVFDAILTDIASGQAAYKAMAERKVPRKAFYALIAVDDNAGNKYARAKQAGLEAMADDTLEIADDRDIESDHKRVMVDTRKWLLSKLAPKKYGDKLDLTHAGDPDRPLVARIEEVIIDSAD